MLTRIYTGMMLAALLGLVLTGQPVHAQTCEGDANGDGAVDPLDGGYVLARFGCPVGEGDPSCDAADVNGDGAVDPLDGGFVLARFGDCPDASEACCFDDCNCTDSEPSACAADGGTSQGAGTTCDTSACAGDPVPDPRNGLCEQDQAVYIDAEGDTVVRRPLAGNDHPVIAGHTIDLIGYRIANWDPVDPADNLFDGDCTDGDPFVEWLLNENVLYMRIDLEFRSRVNPAGPVEPDDFDPTRHGPNPLLGFVQINVEGHAGSGAHLTGQEYGFLGTVGRFGHRANGLTAFAERTARHLDDLFQGFSADPQSRYTGVDFVFDLGAVPSEIVRVERGDTDETFETGEAWVVQGPYLKRATGYEFSAFWDDLGTNGKYLPLGDHYRVRFAHDSCAEVTTVSLVFPMVNPSGEPMDYDDKNEVSILEALQALNDAADENWPTFNPEDDIIEDWYENQVADEFLQAENYSLRMTLATSYATVPADDQPYAWTDEAPDQLVCDFDGDNDVDANDAFLFDEHLATNDGQQPWDEDGEVNGVLDVPLFSVNFNLFDANYDGLVDAEDRALCAFP